MNLVDYEKYYHSGSEFIIPRNEFEKIIEENQKLKEQIRKYKDLGFEHLCKENQRLNNVLNELEEFILNHYIVGDRVQNYSLDCILKRLKELKESDK